MVKIGLHISLLFFVGCLGVGCRSIPFETTVIAPGPASNYPYGQVEPSIAIHPTNPNWMAAAS
ncbi:MAG: hypothetical protein KJ941_12780, partial [Bacteroidetes bacterium]|nr:hypothetical protein [Bacteroidota bacterium]